MEEIIIKQIEDRFPPKEICLLDVEYSILLIMQLSGISIQ